MASLESGSTRKQGIIELTVRSIILAVILTVILAMSNAYLALKLGILTSASIPAAIISMGVLRFFKNSSILENNAVQTAASAGEAVAGGIVYTIPALIIIQYWHHFDYWVNFLIAACGGVLGVLFSIPLRRVLVHDQSLKFPEGRAIAEVLKTSSERGGVKEIVLGGLIGGLIELLQTGFKVVASSWNFWFVANRSLFGFGAGFSPTMLGAGYLVGYEMAVSIFLGAIISWLIAMPIASQFFPEFIHQYPPAKAAVFLWNGEMRYLGIGAMLFAGVWTFLKLVRPLIKSIQSSLRGFSLKKYQQNELARTDRDIPLPFILLGTAVVAVILFVMFRHLFPLAYIGFTGAQTPVLILGAITYLIVVGFLFSVITAYFSGMVGVTASPGSSVVIAGMLIAAWLLLVAINCFIPTPLDAGQMQAAEAVTIIIGSILTGIAAIANDNSQDLKVGQLVGATPWRQQLMLLLGVIVSALVIPPVMQLLFDVYGIAGVMPHEGMDAGQSLPAPVAALMAAVTEAVFRHALPWSVMFIGASVILVVIAVNKIFRLERFIRLSILGIAIGMYLPISSSVPLFIGGMIALLARKRLAKSGYSGDEAKQRTQTGTLIACGLLAGSALLDVLLAIPFSIFHSPDVLMLVGPSWENYGVFLGIASTLVLGGWIIKRVCKY
ncbi:OPT family oligopeptide transporter [Legionella dresdenensis]|uniref:OPT family oligopeptide transporter n=1 Tax=Legionella dresdenensis TaxID=450200 RepID=A0ABV8CIQ8_9GAMM